MTTLSGTVKGATAGATGFDVNEVLSPSRAGLFKAASMAFCIRYLPRTAGLSAGCLTNGEAEAILTEGLALMVVQHCPISPWEPSAVLGTEYGQYAATYAHSIGLPNGMMIWLDLEGVASGTPVQDTINYCQAWFSAVAGGAYVPGLYVGYEPGLSADQLYADLWFKHYWRAYNYDDGVSVRGYQMLQETQKVLHGMAYDPDIVQADNRGDLPIWLSPS